MEEQSTSNKNTSLGFDKLNDSHDVLDYAGDAIIIGDQNGIIIQANKQMCELSGYSKNEIVGKHITTLFSKAEMSNKPLNFDLVNQGIPILSEREILSKDSITIPIEMHTNKTLDGYISVIRDIRKRKDTEKQLLEQMDRLSFVAQMEKIGIIDYDVESKEIKFNEEMCRIMNSDTDLKCNKFDNWLSRIHPDDKYRIEESLNRIIEENSTLEFVYRVIDTETKQEKTIKASASIKPNYDNSSLAIIITSVDITDTKILKSQLRESERTFNSLTETTASAIFIYHDKFIYVNNAFENITGYSKKESTELYFWEIIHPEQQELVKHRGQKRISGEIVQNKYELKIVTKSGETKWLEFTAEQIVYLGKPAALGTAFDITARKKVEEINRVNNIKLKKERQKAIESENRFRQYMEQNSAPMIAIDADTKKINFSNHAAALLYEYKREDLQKMTIYDLHTLSADEINSTMKKALLQSSNKFQFQHITKNNNKIDVLVNASPVMINGKITMVLIIRDITEELNTKSELEKSHDTYKNIIDSISEMVYILDSEGKFLFVNKAAQKKYGYREDEFIGQTPEFLSAPNKNDPAKVGEQIMSAFSGHIEVFEFWGLKNNGGIFPKEVVLSPGYFFGKQVVIAVSRDITKQKAATDEIINAKEKAEENDQLKSAFLANMSHEIRTPMNAILGFSELLKEPEIDDDERIRFSKIINKSSYHLLNLINDLVDISKIHANQMNIVVNSFQLNSLLQDLQQHFEGELINTNKQDCVKLIFSYGLKNENDYIQTDATRLRQILHNIIGNSIKFTKKGDIKISYQVKGNELLFKVQDQGIGIPLDKQDKIFERFGQADPTISQDYGGTGLGLSISKACTELLGGEIWYTSKENIGTEMHFTIPYQSAK